MKQTRFQSWFEAFGGTALGFVMSLAIQQTVNWYYDLPLSGGQSFTIIGIFTVASLLRGYVWWRFCISISIRRPLSPAMIAIVAERYRQIEQEGWSHEHDDELGGGDLSKAGAAYALFGAQQTPPSLWPWPDDAWKPQDHRRNLVRAGALIVAEIEKFDLSKTRKRK